MTVSLLPLYLHVSKQSESIKMELEATHLMYEALQSYLVEGMWADKEEERSEYSYQLSWQQVGGNPVGVCISYVNAYNKGIQKCEPLE